MRLMAQRLRYRWHGLDGLLRAALLVGAALLVWGLIAVGFVVLVSLAAGVVLALLVYKGIGLAQRQAPALQQFGERVVDAARDLRWRWSQGRRGGSRAAVDSARPPVHSRPLRARRMPDRPVPSVVPLTVIAAASVVFALLLFALSVIGLIFWVL